MQDLFVNRTPQSETVHCVMANKSEWKLLTEHDIKVCDIILWMKNLTADEIQV